MTDQLERSLQTHLGGSHTIQYELGGGGMSRVFVADDRALERKVAIKVLNPVLAATVSVARFEREIMVVAKLNHPNIVPVLSAGQVDGLPFFIMPFIEGESLRARIVRGPLSMRETVGILKDVARALAYAHSAGIVHRDIKPDNILIAGTAAVVTDFGVAKAVSAARDRGISSGGQPITGLGVSLGTPQYMAPEQAAADPSADHRADIYALGIVAYEMLVGSPPFHGRTPQALLAAQLTELPPPLASRRYDVPVELSAMIMKCLEKDPADRPRAATDILRLLESPDALAGPVAAPPRAVANRRMKRLTSALSVTGVVLAVGGLLAWSFWPTAPSPQPGPQAVATRAVSGTVRVQPPVAIGNESRDLATAISAAIETALVGAGVAVQTANSAVDSAATDSRVFVLQTTVQRFGSQARANVRLSARGASADTTLWADKLDFRVDSAIVAQDTLAARVVGAVRDAQSRIR
jgi:serine/threonine-protein kinase